VHCFDEEITDEGTEANNDTKRWWSRL
jgi:hypothetical protein